MRRSVLALPLLLLGCATSTEQHARSSFDEQAQSVSRSERAEAPARQQRFDGSLEAYVAYALEHSPALRATFEEWRAATHRIARARRLPEPTLTYAYFVRSVETRVGPQQHKIGISQSFPWPTKLSRGADSASLAADSAKKRFEAAALIITRQVAEDYYRLWLIAQRRKVERDQAQLAKQFSMVVRGRLEVGHATLADLGQTDLRVSRAADTLSGLTLERRSAEAALRATIGAPPGVALPIDDKEPRLLLPAESDEALRAAAADHPRVAAMALMSRASSEQAESAGADQYPSFTVGAEYIVTGEARMAGVQDSGKDPIIVMLGVKVPLWGGTYSEEVEAARADSAAFRAREAAERDRAKAETEQALVDIRDAVRRVLLYRDTLVPQAESVYTSVLGSYQSDRATLAAVLLAERELLELQLSLYRARADHAKAWARLEAAVGRPVRAREVT